MQHHLSGLPAGLDAAPPFQSHLITSFPPAFGYEGLSILLGRDVATLQNDKVRSPEKLPPACTPPGTRNPRWILTDVLEWLSSHREEIKPAIKRGRPTKAEQIRKKLQGGEK